MDSTLKTFLVFKDLPVHVEYRAGDCPLLKKGLQVDFQIDLRNPMNPKKIRKVDGTFVIDRVHLVYSGKEGWAQYIELSPVG